MKQFVRSHKLLWNIAFWILFFIIVASIALLKSSDVSKYSMFLIGVLLILNRIYLAKGSIKRLPYFLSFLALLFILVGLRQIFSSSESASDLFSSTAFVSMVSYFLVSSIVIMSVALAVLDLTKNTLGVETPSDFIRIFTICFFFLVIFYPFVVIHIKRLRDARLSYWWTLLTLIPCVQTLFAAFLCFKGSAKRSSVKKKSEQPRRSSQHNRNRNKRKMRR